MLVAPRVARMVLRYGFGVRLAEGRHDRIAAWLLVIFGLAIVFLGRVVR